MSFPRKRESKTESDPRFREDDICETGSVLLVSLWATATLAALGISQAARVSLELKWASRLQEERQAWYLAWTGLQVESIRLASDEQPNFDAMSEAWAAPTQEPIPLSNGTFSFSVSDEQAKIPLNAAPPDVLDGLPGFTPDAVNQILARRTNPAGPQPIAHVGELPLLGVESSSLSELESVATVYGRGQVNLNTASEKVLMLLGLSEAGAGAIVQYREGKIFQDVAEILAVPGLDIPDKTLLTDQINARLIEVNSNTFRVEVEGQTDRHGIRKKVTAILERGSAGSLPKVRGWYEPRPS